MKANVPVRGALSRRFTAFTVAVAKALGSTEIRVEYIAWPSRRAWLTAIVGGASWRQAKVDALEEITARLG